MKQGTLYGVGVGPGDPELLTLKAIRIINACTYIAIPSATKKDCTAYAIAKAAIPSLEQKDCLCIPMPMTKNKVLLQESHQQGAKQLMQYLKQGFSIAFLTLGDPTIYSTYLYLHNLVAKEKYPTRIVSGIPSFCAAAAALNTGLVEQSEPLHIYPGSYPIEKSLRLNGTKVYMKSGHKIGDVRDTLAASSHTASMIENCGMKNEHIYESLQDMPNHSSYFSLIISKS